MKDCPPDKILNPLTNRCVSLKGAIGKKLMKECPPDKILNPLTNRCVSLKGTIGKKLQKDKRIVCKSSFMSWENNSCYLDSLIIALFNKKDRFIEKYLLDANINDYGNDKLKELGNRIKEELKRIYMTIIGTDRNDKYTCVNFRKLLNNYYLILKSIMPKIKLIGSNDNWVSSQLDVFELLEFLFMIFDIKNTTKISDANNPPIYTNFVNMIPIDFILDERKEVKISDIYPSYETMFQLSDKNAYIDKYGRKHNYYTKRTEILKADKLLIRVSRNIGSMKLKTRIIPCSSLKFKEGGKLYLNSLIIHYGSNQGGHYICLFKCNNKWYEYDDLNSKISKIGSLNNIIDNKRYCNNIVGLVYSK